MTATITADQTTEAARLIAEGVAAYQGALVETPVDGTARIAFATASGAFGWAAEMELADARFEVPISALTQPAVLLVSLEDYIAGM